ncbi:hypothetical protein CLF_107730 [Clonorchis sinensis]|uniref:Uncharacterized protein n=1 Tax=Clonorchis sinensis TaxID=79923 RepID=H2KS06_CLOSI|nr:hypothetical protein CLF_107730 [Clonorchis sinensis]
MENVQRSEPNDLSLSSFYKREVFGGLPIERSMLRITGYLAISQKLKGSVITNKVKSITINECAEEPCVVRAGGPFKINISFISPLNITKPKSRLLYYATAYSTSPERQDQWGIACNSDTENCFKLNSTYNYRVESSLPNEKFPPLINWCLALGGPNLTSFGRHTALNRMKLKTATILLIKPR